MSLYRLQHSYTASQRTNQELEDKLHTLVICPGGQLGWRCAHRIAGAGTCQGTAILPWARGGGVGRGGEGSAVCCESQDCLNAHTVSLLSSSSLMLPPLLPHSPLRPLLATAGFLQLRLSLCVFSLALASSSAEIWDCWGPAIALCPLLSSSSCEACSAVSASLLGDSWGACSWLGQSY